MEVDLFAVEMRASSIAAFRMNHHEYLRAEGRRVRLNRLPGYFSNNSSTT